MIVLLSPAKTMKHMAYKGKTSVPDFINQASKIADQFQRYDTEQLQVWYSVSEKIAHDAFMRWQSFDKQPKTIALFAYQGEAYRNLDASSLSKSHLERANKHIRILSALYGLLRPLDEIALYRLDLTKNFPELGNGVTYWQDVVTKKLIEDVWTLKHQLIINCSSNEYTQMIDIPRIKEVATWIHVNFEYIKDGKPVGISMLAKAARGTLARELSLKPVTSISQMNRYLSDYVCKIDKKQGIVTYIKHI
jgi:cytoplasmic iron level regulating protein YaaA (DUF328/UPF0246 family)